MTLTLSHVPLVPPFVSRSCVVRHCARYDGYVFASAAAGSSVTVVVQLQDVESGTVLDVAALPFTGTGAGNWAMLNFSLTPSGGYSLLPGILSLHSPYSCDHRPLTTDH